MRPASIRLFPCGAALALAFALSACGDDEPNRAVVSFGLEQPSAPVATLTAVVHFPSSVILSHLPFAEACQPAGQLDLTFTERGDGTLVVDLAASGDSPCGGDPEDGCDDPDDSNQSIARSSADATATQTAFALFDCTFDVLDTFSNGDFGAEVTSATGRDEQPIVPLPSIIVTDVNTFDRDPNDGSDDDPNAHSFEMTVAVTNAVGPLGTIQFNIIDTGEGGGFAGAHGTAVCHALIPGALASFNDVGNGELRAAMIDVDGFPTPGDLAACTFRSTGTVSADDFDTIVIDATDPELQKKRPELGVRVAPAD